MENNKSYFTDKNDLLTKTVSSSNIYDDIDWKQKKEKSGIADNTGKLLFGGSYTPVEKMNAKTTELLKQIAIPETNHPIDDKFKPDNERWTAAKIIWNVKEEIAKKYEASFVIEQGSLYYRGTWIKITAQKIDCDCQELQKILNQFCKDYKFDTHKEITFSFPYELPWSEEQKEREDADDRTDSLFGD